MSFGLQSLAQTSLEVLGTDPVEVFLAGLREDPRRT